VGGNHINYPDEVATPTADMLVAKILFNSVISMPGMQFMTMDISNFYLNATLKCPKFIRMHLSDIMDEIIHKFNLHDIVETNGTIYIKIILGMYGLLYAGLIANELLAK
jgi:hypothetical protein